MGRLPLQARTNRTGGAVTHKRTEPERRTIARVEEVLQHDDAGPTEQQCDDLNCGCHEEAPPDGPWLLTDWTLIAAHVHADSGDVWYSLVCPEKTPAHIRDGLLHTGLHW